VAAVTVDVQFTPEVEQLRRTTNNLYPERLNGRSRVGPLQSLAGARPKDDVIVSLEQAIVTQSDGQPALQIETEPVLETGRYYTLVKILGQVSNSKPEFIPKACPGQPPCSSELFKVQHYSSTSGKFDGVQETVRIPQQPINDLGVYASTPRQLDQSPAGKAGWYLYGAQDQTGLFTVEAIQPRSLFQLQPQEILAASQGRDANNVLWQQTKQRKGSLQTVLVDSTTDQTRAIAAPQISPAFPAGTRGLVMHLFGGRGGKHGESPVAGTVTGHFAYGLAKVIRDPFTDQLVWNVHYQQVYATNPEGIISGTNSWANYMGNLQRGWLGTRPVADAIVNLEQIDQDYDFGGIKLSPLSELARQLSLISARYRTGNGTGAANVTPAASCVQDSNQALFLTIQTIREKVTSNPDIQRWWSSHPNDPTIKRFERLITLGDDLQKQLMPLGVVRPDWQSNADALSGTHKQADFTQTGSTENTVTALASWRTILPRQVQDELNTLFLQHGAKLWFLRTNQVGGHNPDIFPIAPTQAFALWTLPKTEIPIVSILFTRILGAVVLPSWSEWGITGLLLLGYGAIALPIGLSQQFLAFKLWPASGWQYLLLAIRLFLMPALVEEFVFRVLLLPSPSLGMVGPVWLAWAAFSLILFIVYHPLNAKTFYKPGHPTFFNPIFLLLTGLLGAVCTIDYLLVGSLLAIAVLHWLVVTAWLTLLGGMAKLHPAASLKAGDV
jgi:predicted Abi (CAAX) family protease